MIEDLISRTGAAGNVLNVALCKFLELIENYGIFMIYIGNPRK